MSIITTVYDTNNALSTGFYHTYKGEKVAYDYIGTESECIGMYNLTFNHPDCDSEVQHVIIRDKVKLASPVHTGFALHNVWSA